MIRYLGDALDEFPGAANQTRCFVHTVNLIAKSILKPFDTRKTKDLSEFSNVVQALADSGDDTMASMGDSHGPEEDTERESDSIEDSEETDGGDESDDEEDEEEEEEEFDASLGPIRSMLLKVCLRVTDGPWHPADWLTKMRKISSTIKNSTTLLLPAWYKTISSQGLPPCMMPQDVSTRWNSTFDMLEFAVRYRTAIDAMTAVRHFDLRKYELVPTEWKIASELRDVLKVSNSSQFPSF
jgi:hypothetical protein